MKIRILNMMCGIAGSGKSTIAKILVDNKNIVSLDSVREFLFDTRAEQKQGNLVYKIGIEKIKYLLSKESDEYIVEVVYDATNLTKKTRAKVLEDLKGYYDLAYCVCADVGLEVAKRQNRQRAEDEIVPDEVLESMQTRLEIPTKDEGFIAVHVVH